MSKNYKGNGKGGVPFATRSELAICVALGCLNIILLSVLTDVFPKILPEIFAVAFSLVYLLENYASVLGEKLVYVLCGHHSLV